MMRAIAALLTVFTFFAGAAQADEHVAGTVTRMQAPVLAVQDALPRILKVGDPIYIGDFISTGKDARIEVEISEVGAGTTSADVAPTAPKKWGAAKVKRATDTVKFN